MMDRIEYEKNEEWKRSLCERIARVETRLEDLEKKVEGIEGKLNWLLLFVVGVVISEVIRAAFTLKTGGV